MKGNRTFKTRVSENVERARRGLMATIAPQFAKGRKTPKRSTARAAERERARLNDRDTASRHWNLDTVKLRKQRKKAYAGRKANVQRQIRARR